MRVVRVRTNPAQPSTIPHNPLASCVRSPQVAGVLAWSPLLVQKIEIQALGFVLRKLQLNRHRPAEVSLHTHPHAQLILYLAGEGVQWVRERRYQAHAGDLFIIPPRVAHGFSVQQGSRPLCLVLDFDAARPPQRLVHRQLSHATLLELHSLLARVPAKGRLRLSVYPAILEVVARLLEASPEAPPTTSRPEPLLDRLRGELERAPNLASLAAASGFSRDGLSRRLKREHGLGLRALRDQHRLAAAELALRSAGSIAAAAGAAGFDDPNYFARWFRRRTGVTPSAWRRRHAS